MHIIIIHITSYVLYIITSCNNFFSTTVDVCNVVVISMTTGLGYCKMIIISMHKSVIVAAVMLLKIALLS